MENLMSNDILKHNLEKWKTLPAGEWRRDVSDLYALEDEELATAYKSFRTLWDSERGWEHERYGKMFSGRDVLEIGSGLGYDALTMSKKAASWTCADILQVNIDFVARMAALTGSENISTQLLEDIDSHNFKKSFTGFYAHGVLHHIPFEIASRQMANISKYLEPGAKAVFLMYPKARWEHAGKPAFENFGISTDGEGTPWAEWYDEEKILKLVGADFTLDQSIPWGWNNIEFINFELTKQQ
jgi:2-polyprenyl-3-methyl-5-hydroxy-6-metoxy-1,4-benzoquinol methylase